MKREELRKQGFTEKQIDKAFARPYAAVCVTPEFTNTMKSPATPAAVARKMRKAIVNVKRNRPDLSQELQEELARTIAQAT